MTEDKPAIEFAFDELAEIVKDKDALGISFGEYLEQLEAKANAAARKLEIARCVADTCEATKTRKPRKDRGVPRKKNGTSETPQSEPA
jgi:hypothetical protein